MPDYRTDSDFSFWLCTLVLVLLVPSLFMEDIESNEQYMNMIVSGPDLPTKRVAEKGWGKTEQEGLVNCLHASCGLLHENRQPIRW